MPNKPYLIKLLKENLIFTKFSNGLNFVAGGFQEDNEQ